MTTRPPFPLVVICVSVLVAGCATAPPPPPRRGESTPRVRCLSDPAERDTRPLFFLFCVESP